MLACDGGSLVGAAASRLVFPQANENTILHAVNTGSQPVLAALLKVYNSNGNLVGTTLFPIAPQGGWSGRIGDLFPSLAGMHGYAVIDSQGNPFLPPEPLAGMASYRQAGDQAILIGQDDSVRVRQGYAVHVVSGGGYTSSLSLANTDSVQQSVQLTLNGTSVQYSIPAHGKLEGSLDQMFNLGGACVTTGYLAMQTLANTSGVIGSVEIAGSGGQLLTAEPITGQDAISLVFPEILQDSRYWTALALLNARQTTATVTMELDSSAGSPLATKAVTIAPGQRVSGMLNELFPGISNQIGGSVRITSTSPIYGVQFFGTTGVNGGNFLATVPPVE